jgi:glycosyltransferase involved in cell wall biosynthesis
LKESDALLAISETTRLQLLAETAEQVPHTDSFQLGADAVPVRSASLRETGQWPTFLMVGTIEPRKGHETVLAAFERLWASGMKIGLIFVGREGWKVSAVRAKIRKLQSACDMFVYHENASDELLGKCYDAADAVIAASFAEGFGLPLVETMQRGKQLIASDIPAFREVAGDFPIYFKPGDPVSLAENIRRFLKQGPRPINQTSRWISWDESSDQLMSKIEQFCDLSNGPNNT